MRLSIPVILILGLLVPVRAALPAEDQALSMEFLEFLGLVENTDDVDWEIVTDEQPVSQLDNELQLSQEVSEEQYDDE